RWLRQLYRLWFGRPAPCRRAPAPAPQRRRPAHPPARPQVEQLEPRRAAGSLLQLGAGVVTGALVNVLAPEPGEVGWQGSGDRRPPPDGSGLHSQDTPPALLPPPPVAVGGPPWAADHAWGVEAPVLEHFTAEGTLPQDGLAGAFDPFAAARALL